MLRAEIEADSFNVVTDISEICDTHRKHADECSLKSEETLDRLKSDFFHVSN